MEGFLADERLPRTGRRWACQYTIGGLLCGRIPVQPSGHCGLHAHSSGTKPTTAKAAQGGKDQRASLHSLHKVLIHLQPSQTFKDSITLRTANTFLMSTYLGMSKNV